MQRLGTLNVENFLFDDNKNRILHVNAQAGKVAKDLNAIPVLINQTNEMMTR